MARLSRRLVNRGMWIVNEETAYRMLLRFLLPGSTPVCTRVRVRMSVR
jgi:hypothetical protein